MPGGWNSRAQGATVVAPSSTGGGWGSRANTPTAAPKPSGHQGLFGRIVGSVGHVIGQGAKDVATVAEHAPGGVYHVGKALGQDVVTSVEHPERRIGPSWGQLASHPLRASNANGSHLYPIVAATGQQVQKDLAHPLRHPGYTLLDVLPFANAAGKVAEAGALARGGELGAAAKSVVTRAAPEPRVVRLPGGGEVQAGTYSRAAGSRVLQKGLDSLRERYPNVHFGLRNQYQRAGFERAANERVRTNLANAPAQALAANAKHATGVGEKAARLHKAALLSMRVVAEKVPLRERIADAERFASEANGVARLRLQRHLTLLRRAARFVEDVPGPDGQLVPRFRAGHQPLEALYAQAKRVADTREQELINAGMLARDVALNRKAAPGDIIRSGARQRAQATQLELGFNPEHTPEAFQHEGDFYISYRNRRASSLGAVPRAGGNAQSVGIPQGLPELGHEFTGAAIRKGLVSPNTPRQVAEDAMRANRVLSLWRQRDELAKLAVDRSAIPAQQAEHYVPIRPIWLKNKSWPTEIRAALEHLDESLAPEEQGPLAQRIRDFVFPKTHDLSPDDLGKVKWIDRRVLDNMNAPVRGWGNALPNRIVDAVNQAERAAILFKPGYVLPNLASNVAINAIQQGFAAIPNLTRAARLNNLLPHEDVVKIDAGMGNGVVASLGDQGVGHAAIQAVQHSLGNLVDVVPRRAAFLFEARRAGFTSARAIHELLNDPAHMDALVRIAREATGEIIDYQRLGPLERGAIRRVLFLYPWTKGSTVYAGRFLREHPVDAAALGQFGQQQAQRDQSELGPLPSYLQGIFKVGGSPETPLIVNPQAISPFGTPAQVVKTIVGLMDQNPGEAYRLSQFLVPLLQAEQQGAQQHRGSAAGNLVHGMYESLPPVMLEKRLTNPPARSVKPRIYPYTPGEALLQYLVGSSSPHRLNRPKANAAAYAEKHPRR